MTVTKNEIGLGVIGLLAWGAIIALAIVIMLQVSSVKDDVQNSAEPRNIDLTVITITAKANDAVENENCTSLCQQRVQTTSCCVGGKEHRDNSNFGCTVAVQANDTCYCSTSEQLCVLPFAGI